MLDELIEMRGKPERLWMDNGPEFVSRLLAERAKRRDIVLQLIQPGKPTQNAYIERFNCSHLEFSIHSKVEVIGVLP